MPMHLSGSQDWLRRSMNSVPSQICLWLVEDDELVDTVDGVGLRLTIGPNDLERHRIVPLPEPKGLHQFVGGEIAPRWLHQAVLLMLAHGEDELGSNRVGIGRIALELNPQPVVAGLGIVSIEIGRTLDAGGDEVEVPIAVHIGRSQAPSHNALGEITGEPPEVEVGGAAATTAMPEDIAGLPVWDPHLALEELGRNLLNRAIDLKDIAVPIVVVIDKKCPKGGTGANLRQCPSTRGNPKNHGSH